MKSLRIFIACADERLRLALILFLDHQPGMFVVAMSDRLAGLLAQLKAAEPDVLLLDWDLPVQSTADLLTFLQELDGQPKSIVLSSRQKEKEEIMAAGAHHFISKDTPPDELIPVLNNIRSSKSISGPS